MSLLPFTRASWGIGTTLSFSKAVSWFWFGWVVCGLMIVADVAWWVVGMHLAKGKVWRVLVTVFMAVQLAIHVLFMSGLVLPGHVPKALLVAAMVWHYLAVAGLLPLGIVCAYTWGRGLIARVRGVQRDGLITVPASPNSQTRREFFGAAAALVPPLFTVGMTGVALAQIRNLRVRRFALSIPALPRALDGITIAHVTDIHVGVLTCGRVMREMINLTNALRADLVLLTGDLIDYDLSDLSECISLVKAMESRYGMWMIEGNHDLAVDGGEFERRVKAAGLPLLLDESAVANVRGYPVQCFGLRWMPGIARARGGGLDHVTASQMRLLLQQRQPEAFPILLSHHPHAFDAAVQADLPLTLAGHTHGGQFMLGGRLGVGPALFRYWSGHYTRGRSQMIVSNGVGNVFPIRINAPAEIVHLTLRCT
jgi:predicted MPP superfamily phosphohydrolase